MGKPITMLIPPDRHDEEPEILRRIRRGERVAAFFWIQSLIRSDAQRTLLFDMDVAIQSLAAKLGGAEPAIVSLTGAYHNLLRQWAEM